jgi:acetoin utilization protein AcuC
MHEAALLSTGASLAGAELLMNGTAGVVFSPSGGLHHAMPGRASGFCIYNDPVIAIKAMVARGLKVAYVDIDVHHGDGVQHAFYDTDQVLTISLHESGRFLFPGSGFVEEIGTGRGRGYSVNVPLAPLTDDEIYGWAFLEVVPPLFQAFKPDILVTQLGIDTNHSDPLAHLGLTSTGYESVLRTFAQQSGSTGWLALGGGGYDLSAVARCWTLAYGIMAGCDWPDTIPDELQEHLGTSHLRDRQTPSKQPDALEMARNFARDSVRQVQDLIFPYHNL